MTDLQKDCSDKMEQPFTITNRLDIYLMTMVPEVILRCCWPVVKTETEVILRCCWHVLKTELLWRITQRAADGPFRARISRLALRCQ